MGDLWGQKGPHMANNTPPLSVTGSVIAPSARMITLVQGSSLNKSTRSNPVSSSAAATGVAFAAVCAALASNSAAGQSSGVWEDLVLTRRTHTLTDREAGRETEREKKRKREITREKIQRRTDRQTENKKNANRDTQAGRQTLTNRHLRHTLKASSITLVLLPRRVCRA